MNCHICSKDLKEPEDMYLSIKNDDDGYICIECLKK